MTEEKTAEESYKLSESKRKDLISGLKGSVDEEGNKELEEFAQRLSKSKENVDKGEAWISAIIPPNSKEKSPSKEDKIKVEFLLPSGDTFWEEYRYSQDYMSNDHDFIKLVKHVGYDVNALEYVVGQSIEIEYDKSQSEWTVKSSVFEDYEDEESNDIKKKILYAIAGVGGLILSIPTVMLIVRTRGLALVVILLLMTAFYMIYLAINDE